MHGQCQSHSTTRSAGAAMALEDGRGVHLARWVTHEGGRAEPIGTEPPLRLLVAQLDLVAIAQGRPRVGHAAAAVAAPVAGATPAAAAATRERRWQQLPALRHAGYGAKRPCVIAARAACGSPRAPGGSYARANVVCSYHGQQSSWVLDL